MRSTLKKIQTIVFILLIITVLFGAGLFGMQYYKMTRKQYPFGIVIDEVWNKYVELAKVDDKYYLGDDFTIKGELDVNLTSEDYANKALSDIEYLNKNNRLTNLSNMDIHYLVKHDLDNGKLYLELDEKIGEDEILKGKYLVDDSTGYYYVDSILQEYINGGNNTYFEMLKDKNTTKANRNYLYAFVRESLKRNLLEEDLLGFDTETNIGDESVKVGEVSLKLDNKTIRKILNGIIKDIKKDSKANLIMTSVDKDFSSYKIKDTKKFLKKNESYTINIYTSKVLRKPLKVEVVHLVKDDQEIYTYEGDTLSGTFYYSKNNDMKYSAIYRINSKNKNKEIIVFDRTSKELGRIIIDKNKSDLSFKMNLKLEEKEYNINYSFKHKNYKENKSFDIEKVLKIKVDDGLINIIEGDISHKYSVKKGAKVEEDISEAILENTLSSEDKEKYDNLRDDIKTYLETIR